MANDPSDWDPLPEAGAAQHPGEAASIGPGAGAPRFAVLPGHSALAVPAAVERNRPEPAVKARDSATLDADRLEQGRQSLTAIMQGARPSRGDKAPLPKSQAPATKKAPPVVPANRTGDPRLGQPWFLALPAVEQQHLLRAWADEGAVAQAQPQRRRQELLEWFWVAYVVFFVAALPLMLVEGLAGFVRMAMAGCVTGMVWQLVPRTRLWCVVSAVSIYVSIVILPRLGELADSPFDLCVTLGGGCIVGYLASLALHEDLHRRPEA